ncbi:class I SAM-dependent methyltransferase [Actinospica durhamensis]|uniref:Class I SAM-dependent methyltransferase n=1 Tax=Actinospica durhamensis TaxID=1508375 RepID=A0A941ENW2_9ACTN|nr:O-methyltransferase [Actinospica durhamensis]MBR7833838.1 class I SAM-dependent methyltransferase [Actinospica durhamensis]
MTATPVPITPELHTYLLAHTSPRDEVQNWLIERTAELGGVARMQIAPEQGVLLTILARLTRAEVAVEVGTFTGYSSICIARGLAEGGRLICCDISEQWTAIAREAWSRAGVAERIDLRIAPALETLEALPAGEHIDFAFVDADKEPYWEYYSALITRLRPGGILAFDNTFRNGDVVDSRRAGAGRGGDPDPGALHVFNERLVADERVEVVMLPIADGLTVAQKR